MAPEMPTAMYKVGATTFCSDVLHQASGPIIFDIERDCGRVDDLLPQRAAVEFFILGQIHGDPIRGTQLPLHERVCGPLGLVSVVRQIHFALSHGAVEIDSAVRYHHLSYVARAGEIEQVRVDPVDAPARDDSRRR